jgi:RNA polymerase sigma-70 factor (ECF subfamily)
LKSEREGVNTTPISLLERLRTNPDEDSWRRMVEIYTPFIQRWMRQNRISPHDAEDISQEVLAALLRRLPEFEHSGRPGAFRRWLRLIIFHRIVGYWRSRKPDQMAAGEMPDLSQLEDTDSSLSQMWDAEHDAHVARRLLMMLEPEFTATTWQAFRRTVVDKARPAQVAADLGLTVNAVLLAKFRVLRRFREEAAGLVE